MESKERVKNEGIPAVMAWELCFFLMSVGQRVRTAKEGTLIQGLTAEDLDLLRPNLLAIAEQWTSSSSSLQKNISSQAYKKNTGPKGAP